MARFLKDKQKSKGADPGALIFIGHPKMEKSSLHLLRYNADTIKEIPVESAEKIIDDLSEDYTSWISLYGLQDTHLISQIGRQFNINSLILEDILNTDERPKFIEDNNHLFIILKALNFDKETARVQMEQIALVVGSHYLISIQESQTDYFEDVTKRLYDGRNKMRSYPPDYLCYTMIDTLVDSYIINIEKLGSVIEDQEKILLTAGKKMIEDIYHYKTELSFIRKNVRPVKELMTRFVTSDSDLINTRTYNYLRDLEGLVTQALEAIEIFYTMVADQQNSYNANISNNVNDVMKVLTIFSAVFSPLTFIVGVYGMNFINIPALHYHNAYFILWGVMVGIVMLMIIFFKRKKWL